MMNVRVRYFAQLRDAAGTGAEDVTGEFRTPADLWTHLCARHVFPLGAADLRVSVNAAYVPFDVLLGDGDEVAFIPPVSGG
jgi:molybdopterin synthase sulfur carrier subunit